VISGKYVGWVRVCFDPHPKKNVTFIKDKRLVLKMEGKTNFLAEDVDAFFHVNEFCCKI